MSDLSPQEIEFLILGYEELDPDDRAVADTYLRRHPELAARLQWHQQKEGQAVEKLPVADFLGQDVALQSADEEAQQESLRQVLAGLNLNAGSAGGLGPRKVATASFTHHLRRQARWALPLAAVLAVVILMPRGADKALLLTDLVVTRVELAADGSRGVGGVVRADESLHSGQAFVLEFYLAEDAFVVVYHVDPAGAVSRVYPETLSDDLTPHRGEQAHQIPSLASGETWVLGHETGTESFLVASGSAMSTDLDRVLAANNGADRSVILADLELRLEGLMEQVVLYEFDHIE